ncbi:hypothetical protein ID866_3910 [Astraeus odoratus]|nr:hypothetical protein ID866_3910 [Astraeus odoratus]
MMKYIPFIRSFHSSALQVEYSLTWNVYIPPCTVEPNNMDKCGPPLGALNGKLGLAR